MKVGKEVEFAKYAAITYVFKYPSSDIFNEPATFVSSIFVVPMTDKQQMPKVFIFAI